MNAGAVLVDSNVLLDVLTEDPRWFPWSGEALAPQLFERHPLPWEAAFLAGKCFLRYRRRGGQKGSTLPDFYIGAHAAIAGMRLLTRDGTRYRTYFPALRIIAPRRGFPA